MKLCTIKTFFLDLIFPRFCLGCQKELRLKETSFICGSCLNNIVLNGVRCHICGLRNERGTCRYCLKKKKTNLSGLFAAGKYQDPVLREAIHQFKYQSVESLKKPLAELAVKYLKKENLMEKFRCPTSNISDVGHRSCLVPIPLTWPRKLKRGFNQSELLAQEISKYLQPKAGPPGAENLPVINLLKRKKFTAPQARIADWQTRKKNISGAFTLSPSYPPACAEASAGRQNYRFSESIVVLVDDVATSGATLEEAARVLKEAGVKEVYGLVIAKG